MSPTPKTWKDKTTNLREEVDRFQLPLAFVSGSIVAIIATRGYQRFFKRIRTSDWVTPDMWTRKRWIKGKVTSVGDNDNFRLYHTPAFGWGYLRRVPKSREGLKDQTIHIRMAGIDAPEASHFGRESQKYSGEALEWLKTKIEGKVVYCQLLRKDQYSRIVAFPHHKPRFLPGFLKTGKPIPLEMLRAGWACVYEQTGAEYGVWGKDHLLSIQAEAQANRRGIWQDGTDIETPAQYKRRHSSPAEVIKEEEITKPQRRKAQSRRKWWSFLGF